MKYQPPYTITPQILNRVAAISEAIGRLTVITDQVRSVRLRPSVAPAHPCARDILNIRVHNRIRTICGCYIKEVWFTPLPASLSVEGMWWKSVAMALLPAMAAHKH